MTAKAIAAISLVILVIAGYVLFMQTLHPGTAKCPVVPVNTANMKELTAMADAINQDDHIALKKVLESGANPNIVVFSGETVVHCAAARGSGQCVQVLLEHGANVSIADNQGRTVLHHAVRTTYGKPEIVGELLRAGADASVKNRAGKTPLDVARESQAEAGEDSPQWNSLRQCIEILQERTQR